MNKIYTILASLLFGGIASLSAATHTLDLTKSTTPLSFDENTGAWTENFNDAATVIDSQIFSFVHGAIADMGCWWGFTASNSADNSLRADTYTYQFSNMAAGGIEIGDDGMVKLNENGSPVVSAAAPYLVAYYGSYFAKRPVDLTFKDGKSYCPVGVYVNQTSYPYYVIEQGDGFCRAFADGDKYTLTIHGVAADNTEKSIEVNLATFENGDLTITRGWKYVDLTSLGAVNEIYFTMSTTDVGDWGDNTPEYFAMAALTVKDDDSSVATVPAAIPGFRYCREESKVYFDAEQFATLCDAAGGLLLTSDSGVMDLASLPAGIYVVRSGNASLKIAR